MFYLDEYDAPNVVLNRKRVCNYLRKFEAEPSLRHDLPARYQLQETETLAIARQVLRLT